MRDEQSTEDPECRDYCRGNKLRSIGVKVVTDVDKSGFVAVADPYLDKLAKELGPHAEKVKNLIRAIN
jgi:hypothetical protein